MILGKIYLAGLAILVAAVVLNALAGWLGLATWYDFFRLAGEVGFARSLGEMGWVNWVWLVVVYPFLLGGVGFLALRVMGG